MPGEFVDLPHLDDELSIRVVLGNSSDGMQVQFARATLKRLIGLEVDLLAVPHQVDELDYRPPALTAKSAG
ncbi:hypothetical protein [Actinophytocola gossypii]|uniref:Uncharacterized protein n=1 Tax=Actinophytocola gossypii TaxID=2812003 RepID=A0ABT2JKP6_9PSEU|nr:hypothetical protein [Actinophytocola gossypii]MCT2587965.1 hypothetical protein [Actinophytocola gossypii]